MLIRYRLILIIFLFASRAYSQQDTAWVINLDSVVIRDNRISNTYSEISRNVNVVLKKEIATIPAQSLPEILLLVPGVDIRQRGPVGVQADIGLRGGSFEQTLIMVNGIKMTDPQTGHHNLNLPFNISNVEQVEVIKGPGARQYGQNAFSGAVNFITKIPESRQLETRFYAGSFGSFGGALSISLPAGILKQNLTLSGDRSDGYRENTDYTISNIFYESSLAAGKGEIKLMGGYIQRKFGANGFYASPAYTRQYEEVRTALFGLGYEVKSGNFTFYPRIYWRNNRDYYLFVREDPSIYQNLHFTDVAGAEINSTWKNSLGILGLGVEARVEAIHGTWVRGGLETKSNLDGFDRNNFGMFLEQRFTKNQFDITPGIYAGYYNNFGWNAFPGINAGYGIDKNWRVYINAGRSYRVPNFYEMYYESPVERGDPNLQPESSVSYEAGIKHTGGPITGEFNVFRQTGRLLIDWVQIPVTDSTFYWQAENISNITRTGVEIGTNFDLSRLLINQSWLRWCGISYNYIISGIADKNVISRYILENLKHQVIMSLEHRLFWRLYHRLNIRYNQREGMNGYWVFDSRVFWEIKEKPVIFIEATNWTNTQYIEVMTPMPGRWIRVGINYRLGF